MKPEAYDIKKLSSSFRMVYRCPVCQTDFSHYQEKERFCHHCGIKIEWEDCVKRIDLKVINEIRDPNMFPFFSTKYNEVPHELRCDYTIHRYVKKLYGGD